MPFQLPEEQDPHLERLAPLDLAEVSLSHGNLPPLSQADIAYKLINTGYSLTVFSHLKAFEHELNEVVQMLLDTDRERYLPLLLKSLERDTKVGLGPFRELGLDVAKTLIDSILPRVFVSWEASLLQSFLRGIDRFSPPLRETIPNYIIEELVKGENPDVFGIFFAPICFETFSPFFDKHPEWLSMLTVKKGRPDKRSILSHVPIEVIEEYGYDKLASQLFKLGKLKTFLDFLPHLSGLGNEIAQKLIDAGFGSKVLYFSSSFEGLSPKILLLLAIEKDASSLLSDFKRHNWDRDSFLKVVDAVLKQNGLQTLIDNLSSIPDRFLAYLEDSYSFLSYQRNIGIPSTKLYNDYLGIKRRGSEVELVAFLHEIKELTESMVCSGEFPPALYAHRYYPLVANSVYPSHAAGEHGLIENEHDEFGLDEFELVEPFFVPPDDDEIFQDILDEFIINDEELPEEQVIDEELEELLENLQDVEPPPIQDNTPTSIDRESVTYRPCPHDRSAHISKYRLRPYYRMHLSEGVKMELKEGCHLDEATIRTVENAVGKAKLDLSAVSFERAKMEEVLNSRIDAMCKNFPAGLNRTEDKIYYIILESLAGRIRPESIKDILLIYHFVRAEDIRGYLEGTHDRALRAPNRNYAYLLYLREFFADSIRDTVGLIAQTAERNTWVQAQLPTYYTYIEAALKSAKAHRLMAQAQMEKLGATPKFLDSLNKVLTNKALASDKKYQVVSGMIASEQGRIAGLLSKIRGRTITQEEVHVGSFNPKEVSTPIEEEVPQKKDPKYLKTFISNLLTSTFRSELELIDLELFKYRPGHGARAAAMVLDGVITKNEPSMHARAVAGVCVSSDKQQWNQPNYFQMVLRDPNTKRCEGVLMLHSFSEKRKNILVVSFQPTSTYLHKVDEAQLFRSLLEQLIIFAKENKFNYITCSTNNGIRTNRTGGEFELAIQEKIREVGKEISLGKGAVFSYNPGYTMQTLDVLWEQD